MAEDRRSRSDLLTTNGPPPKNTQDTSAATHSATTRPLPTAEARRSRSLLLRDLSPCLSNWHIDKLPRSTQPACDPAPVSELSRTEDRWQPLSPPRQPPS